MASTNNKDHLPNGEFTQKGPKTSRIRSLKPPDIPVRMQRRLIVKPRPKPKDSFLKGNDSLLKEEDFLGKDPLLKEGDSLLKDLHLKEEDLYPKEEDLHLKEDDLHLKEDDLHLKEEDLNLKEEDLHLEEEDLHLKEEDLHLKGESLVKGKDSLLKEKEETAKILRRKQPKIPVRMQRQLHTKPLNKGTQPKGETSVKVGQQHIPEISVKSKRYPPIKPLAKRVDSKNKSIFLQRKLSKTSVRQQRNLLIKPKDPLKNTGNTLDHKECILLWRRQSKISVQMQHDLPMKDSLPGEEAAVEVVHNPIRGTFPMNSQDHDFLTKDEVQGEVSHEPVRGTLPRMEPENPVTTQRNLPINSQDEVCCPKDEVQVEVDQASIVETLQREKLGIPARIKSDLPMNSEDEVPPMDEDSFLKEVQVEVDDQPNGGTLRCEQSKIPERMQRNLPMNSNIKRAIPNDEVEVDRKPIWLTFPRKESKIPARMQRDLARKPPDVHPKDAAKANDAIQNIGISRREPSKTPARVQRQLPKKLPAVDSLLKEELPKTGRKQIGILRLEHPQFPLQKPMPVSKSNRREHNPLVKSIHQKKPNPCKDNSSMQRQLPKKLPAKDSILKEEQIKAGGKPIGIHHIEQPRLPAPINKNNRRDQGPLSKGFNQGRHNPSKGNSSGSAKAKQEKGVRLKETPQMDKPLARAKEAVQEKAVVVSSLQKKPKPSKANSSGPATPQIDSPLNKTLKLRQDQDQDNDFDPKLFEIMAIYMGGPPKLPTYFSTAAFCHLTQRMRDNNEFSKLKALVGLINQQPTSHLESLIQFFYMAEYLELKFYVRKMHFPDVTATPEMRFIVDCYVFDDCKEFVASIGVLQSQLHALARLFPKARENFRFIDNAFELTFVNGRLTKWLKAALDMVNGQQVYQGLGELALNSTRRLPAIYDLPEE